MFFSDDFLSDTEKVDRIYRMLRANRRERIFGLVVKFALLGAIVYGYHYLSLPEHADVRAKISADIQTKISDLMLPMVGNMVQDLTQNMQNAAQTDSGSAANTNRRRNNPNGAAPVITPEMIKAVQDAMKK